MKNFETKVDLSKICDDGEDNIVQDGFDEERLSEIPSSPLSLSHDSIFERSMFLGNVYSGIGFALIFIVLFVVLLVFALVYFKYI